MVSAAKVKELRDKTGAGMMDCKGALNECDGDMDAAVDWLRTKGLAKAAKKSGRIAAEGLIGALSIDNKGIVIEVNSETDFVAKNGEFQEMVQSILDLGLNKNGDYDSLKSTPLVDDKTVDEYIKEKVGTIGENMNFRRSQILDVSEGVVSSYIHNSVAQNLGSIGVLVGLKSSGDKDKLHQFARQIAMHIAATNPLALKSEDIDKDVADRERAIFAEQSRESGKPENIIEKMVEGRMRKFYQESVLLSQTFVIDGENAVSKAVENFAKDLGADVEVTGFIRFQLGEGIEKKEENFADEVAQVAKG